MSIFDILTLFGGLALFLYGMRIMGNGLKESSSGTLKVILEKVTSNAFKAFLLGMGVTALIQSSTATIVITSGLVAAGLISFRSSIGIIMGANVGTTITGQIVRLLDIDSSSAAWLQILKPSSLAPIALVAGIILIMFVKKEKTDKVGGILMGFGILFIGLLNMTSAVSALSANGVFEKVFTSFGNSPFLGYLSGAGVSFVLQSSSATIGILQAFSTSGALTFKAVYPIIVGVYLGDCVTTAIVCSIGAKTDAKRVGIANILFNLTKTFLVFIGMFIVHKAGLIDGLWERTVNSGIIANTNSVFNLACTFLMIPFARVYEDLSRRIVKDDVEPVVENKYHEALDALNPVFFSTPALAFGACYNALNTMFDVARKNIERATDLLYRYDPAGFAAVDDEETSVDLFADRVSAYLVQLSPSVTQDSHARILDQYYKDVAEFERLSDHALNIAMIAKEMQEENIVYSQTALQEISILTELIGKVLDEAELAFKKRDIAAAKKIEPLEEVVDDLVSALKDRHLQRMRAGLCNVLADVSFTNLMSDLERISDVCSNIGVATVVRVEKTVASETHSYMSLLHAGKDEQFNTIFENTGREYFGRLAAVENDTKNGAGSETAGADADDPELLAYADEEREH
ncbi:MAG: Na/Pi cotransporter family protein [Lachnospiraceae bacterium]|nr:Na/Pi cotransporter family protein [Lachnospiraceae bacterium]